ncbi:MAG: FKBP-type peptidyl-prolyl cis-trans isomerase [Actinobacteria bacterium]|nr:FKBP-type peptidyl-prolyl cis-trans isomerase [Actinomycetota bacterium]
MALSRGRRRVAVLGVVACVLGLGVATACGDDNTASTTTVAGHDTARTGSGADGASGSSTTAASTPEAKAIQERGEPKVAKVDAPVTELKITDDVVGTGKEAKAGDTVTAQYVGAVASTGKVFQSSWQMDGAVQFPLGQVIPGWSKGIPGMKEGGRRTLVIPAAMAYGANPPPASGIPPNADLIFVVDLVSVDG